MPIWCGRLKIPWIGKSVGFRGFCFLLLISYIISLAVIWCMRWKEKIRRRNVSYHTSSLHIMYDNWNILAMAWNNTQRNKSWVSVQVATWNVLVKQLHLFTETVYILCSGGLTNRWAQKSKRGPVSQMTQHYNLPGWGLVAYQEVGCIIMAYTRLYIDCVANRLYMSSIACGEFILNWHCGLAHTVEPRAW